MRKAFKQVFLFLVVFYFCLLPQGASAQVEPFIGEIRMFAGGFAPRGWTFCDGQLISVSSNDALFSILGTTYGGDGRTTFGLPDLRGRVPIHAGSGPGLPTYRLGTKGGEEKHTLSANELPSHNHTLQGTDELAVSRSPNDTTWAKTWPNSNYRQGSSDVDMKTGTFGAAGGGGSHENRQPTLGVNYIIALQGIFPSRN